MHENRRRYVIATVHKIKWSMAFALQAGFEWLGLDD